MKIHDDVKKLALDTVCSPEGRAWLKLFNCDIRDVSPETLFTPKEPVSHVLSERVKGLARDAVSSEMQNWVRQLEYDGVIQSPFNFRPVNVRMAEKVMRAYEAAEPLSTTHKLITRDQFGIDYD